MSQPSATQGTSPPHSGGGGEALAVVPLRHFGRWIGAAAVAVAGAMLVHSLVTNPNFQWGVIARYFTAATVLAGLGRTLLLTLIAMVMGIVLGTVLAVMRLSENPIVAGASSLYIWFFRGTPVLVQLLLWYNLASLYPHLSLGIPFGPAFVSANTNSLISIWAAASLGLGLNEGAYMAEIVRAGIMSVEHGQTEAALSLGMTGSQTMRRIVLPQAMRVIIPPTGNETIGMLKTSSLVSVISMYDLLYSVQAIYSRTYQTIPLLLVASLWYLAVTSLLSVGQFFIERHFSRGNTRARPPQGLARLVELALRSHRSGQGVSGEPLGVEASH